MRIILSLLCVFALFNVYGTERWDIKDAKNVQGEKYDEFAVMPVTSLELGKYKLEITSKEGYPAKLVTDLYSNPICLSLYKGAILTVTSVDGTHDFQSLRLYGAGRSYNHVEVAEGTNGAFTSDADIHYSHGIVWFRPDHEAVIDAVSIRMPEENNQYGEPPYIDITQIRVDGLKPSFDIIGDVSITPITPGLSEVYLKLALNNCTYFYYTPWIEFQNVSSTYSHYTLGKEEFEIRYKIPDYCYNYLELEASNDMMRTEITTIEIPPITDSIDKVDLSSDSLVDIYTLTGIQVAHSILKSEIRNILSPGFYIVVSENDKEKVRIE